MGVIIKRKAHLGICNLNLKFKISFVILKVKNALKEMQWISLESSTTLTHY